MRNLALSILGLAVCLTVLVPETASASLIGDKITVEWLFPNKNTVLTSDRVRVGSGPEIDCETDDAEFCNFFEFPDTTLDIRSSSIKFTPQISVGTGIWTDRSFNGFKFSDLDFSDGSTVDSVTLSSSNFTGLSNSDVSFTDDSITINLAGAFGNIGGTFTLDIDTTTNIIDINPQDISFKTYFGKNSGYQISTQGNEIKIEIDLKINGEVPGPFVTSLWHQGIENVWGDAYQLEYENNIYDIDIDVDFVSSNADFEFNAELCGAGETDCRSSVNNWFYGQGLYSGFSQAEYEYAVQLLAAHEFGHILGLKDEYFDLCLPLELFCTSITLFEFQNDESIMGAEFKNFPIPKLRHFEEIFSHVDYLFNGTPSFIVNPDYDGLAPLGIPVNIADIHQQPVDVPEPTTIALFAIGIAGLAATRRRWRSAA